MSYDISVGSMNRNMTSNVARMWDRAMPQLNMRDMHMKLASVCLPHLEAGIMNMTKDRMFYEVMEKACVGWGSAYGALTMLIEMAHECRLNPDEYVWVNC